MLKICGLTRLSDLGVCQELGIDLTGFIFHPGSSRYVSPDLVAAWPKQSELRVGVWVEEDAEKILEITEMADLDLVQLHGNQDPEFCRSLDPGRVIKTFWPERFEQKQDFEQELARYKGACRFFLFDAGRSLGGHGRGIACPWLREVRSPGPFLLAGGLGPENLDQALDLRPAGVDLNSGVEIAPGRKDPEKISQAVKQVRGLE